ncbi:MAG: acyltransferase [Clostridia bacterium]|nr:acyltransferase [Clostridia bacterium]
MELQKKGYLQRESGVELLKVIAIFLIMLNHLTQTWFGFMDTLSVDSMNAQQFILVIFRYCGTIGNLTFFACSAWFLLDKRVSRKQKIVQLLLDNCVISVLYLIIPLATKADYLTSKLVLRSVFPTTFENNWYITCYIVFYMLFPFLNKLLGSMERRTHLRAIIVLCILYIVINNFSLKAKYYYSALIVWVAIYFIIAYMKQYQGQYCDNKKRNVLVLCGAFLALIALVGGTWFVARKWHLDDIWLLRWLRVNNPIVIVMAIAALNVGRNLHFKSAVINYIASLSFLIYIIHENIIFRTYYRKYMWQFVCDRFGAHTIWAWALLLAAVLFVASVVAATLYKFTLQQLTQKFSVWILAVLRKPYLKIENKLIKTKKSQAFEPLQEHKEPVGSVKEE